MVQQNRPTSKSQGIDNKDAIAILNTFVEEVSLKLNKRPVNEVHAIRSIHLNFFNVKLYLKNLWLTNQYLFLFRFYAT